MTAFSNLPIYLAIFSTWSSVLYVADERLRSDPSSSTRAAVQHYHHVAERHVVPSADKSGDRAAAAHPVYPAPPLDRGYASLGDRDHVAAGDKGQASSSSVRGAQERGSSIQGRHVADQGRLILLNIPILESPATNKNKRLYYCQ